MLFAEAFSFGCDERRAAADGIRDGIGDGIGLAVAGDMGDRI